MWPLNGKQIFEMIYGVSCDNPALKDIKIDGIITDSRQITNHNCSDSTHLEFKIPLLFVAIQGENFDGHAYLKDCFAQGLSLALVNKHSSYLKELDSEMRSRCLPVDDVILSVREFAKNFRSTFTFPVIGIGGSNGKTTTKEILFSFLSFDHRKITKTQKSENGFLGIAFTLLQKDHCRENPPNALVLEIGIDDIGAMEKHVQITKPDVVLLTALGPEHLTGLKNWDTAAKEECILFNATNCKRIWQLNDPKIYEYFLNVAQNPTPLFEFTNDYFIFEVSSYDSDVNRSKFKDLLTKKSIDSNHIVFWCAQDITPYNLKIKIAHDDTFNKVLICETIPLSGKHNAANFALAFGAASAVGLTSANILNGFQQFTPPPQRSNLFSLPDDTILFDDTYNASPASVLAALDILRLSQWNQKKKIIVLGDMLELGDESQFWHESLFPHLKGLSNTHLCLFGSAMYNCYRLFKEMDTDLIQNQQMYVEWLGADQNPAEFFEKLSSSLKGSIILVKGSRGMRLERFVHCIKNSFHRP